MKKITSLKYILLFLLFFISSPYFLFGALDTFLHLKIVELDHADEPEFYGKYIIFTFKPATPVRFVAAIFDHEGYNIRHIYQLNDNGIYFLLYPVPGNIQELKYRLVVDGLIMKDPSNPVTEQDILGIDYSLCKMTKVIEIRNPKKGENGEVYFVYKSRPGRVISLVGTFNDWDPYLHVLKEAPSGYYFITLRVAPGRYFYYFLVDGEKILDLNNPDVGVTAGGDTVSFFDY